MSTIQDQARDEAYASAPADQIVYHVVELDTPAFEDGPMYFMAGVEERTAVRLETGGAVWAEACAFDLTPPGFGDSGPTPAKLRIDGVSVKLFPVLKQAAAGGAIRVTYRAYLGGDREAPADRIVGLELKRVVLSASAAEGELTYAEIATQAFPRRTYDLGTYPALWNA